MDQRNWWPRGWRGVALLVIGGVMLANLVSPAIANIGTVNHLWNQHIKPKGDARWVRQSGGPILVSVPVTSLELNSAGDPGGSLFRTTNMLLWSRGSAGVDYLNPSAALPTTMYGQSVELMGMEVCYDATLADAYLDFVGIWVFRASTSPWADNPLFQIDQTDRTDDTCRTYLLDTPFQLTSDDVVASALGVTATGSGGAAWIGRMTYILQPSGTTATLATSWDVTTLRVATKAEARMGIEEG